MILTKRLVADFDLRFDRFNSQYERNFRLVDKLSIINEAFQIYFDNRVELAEVNSQVRAELRPFEIKEKRLTNKTSGSEFDIFDLPPEIYKLLRIKAVIKKGKCPPLTLPVTIFQTDDLNESLKNTFWKTSYEWEQIIGDEGKEGFYVFHQGEVSVIQVYADYLIQPPELHAPSLAQSGSYEDWNGVTRTQDIDLDSNVFNARIITDIAVLIARNVVGDVQDLQASTAKLLQQKNF